ncbi:c-type cytochrome [Aquirufa nivalisilvae]|uniref:Quinoprotein glucose dehydrogenase (PQQ, quinone) n=1 Tax=Aquirufa nivalisilvae TaxID=2516557 RepID=A0A2S2DWI7_9BACT|nr:PVC-type heme-binding CxxCH protein [Aquirufa nivalisilvae]AWL09758.1 Quinoprotein glucose dehydrogenase (PQQ, quinone) [Aquirufa nivalisilvae]MCZ2480383.1 c-type cytochrome [Aquirufa nivalisilvae]MCZ2482616.1 c-type cytochrome [Aquirufa nivalisilvae]
MNLTSSKKPFLFTALSLFALLFASSFYKNQSARWGQVLLDSLTESQKRQSENALKGLKIHPELEITLFASEPMLQNPTNIDVDAQGRVWVVEAYNYRPNINGNPTNSQGDKVLILEDTNGDGKADSRKIFYQSPELNAPLGIAVLDSMVIVSQSPYIWRMFDDNRDGKADRKEVMFQGIGGEQHDHGAHAFTFGPDGKLYFNFGNEGGQLLDAQGKAVLDQDGDPIGPKKYKQGMVFRCNVDGSQVEVLGHNFRNNYEVAVDSYGGLWQSDNDDDGNKGVRINFVMEHGNYGYRDEMSDAGWSANRTNIEPEIPSRHWHLNDPGVVPNLLQTGSGSPTGMILYEGNLLPKAFQNQMIHCDAGPNVVRSYPVKAQGAGFEASILPLVEGVNDQWFRPADVTAAPDGSVFIADWYDPGVGGHQAGDQTKGRIYRVAPKGHAYQVKSMPLNTPENAILALENPNLAQRYLAFKKLMTWGQSAEAALEKSYQNNINPRMKARAFWALMKTSKAQHYLNLAAKDGLADIRMMAIRQAKRTPFSQWKELAAAWAKDENPQVRRELAIALRHIQDSQADVLWAQLAQQHTGQDRWYLEALGIGADGLWNSRLNAYLALSVNPTSPAFQDVVWRSRTEIALPYIFTELKSNQALSQKLRYFRALDFIPSDKKSSMLIDLIAKNFQGQTEAQLIGLRHINPSFIASNADAKKVLRDLLPKTSEIEYLELVEKYELAEEKDHVLQMILTGKQSRKAGSIMYKLNGGAALISKTFQTGNEDQKKAIIESIRWIGQPNTLSLLFDAMNQKNLSMSIRKEAARSLGNSANGENYVLDILKNKKVSTEFIPSVVEGVSRTWRKAVRMEANSYLGGSSQNTKTKHPDLNTLLGQKGNAQAGIKVFVDQCSMCHQVYQEGIDFGPKLTEIGSKLSKDGMFVSIMHPNAGINFGYETYEILTKSGENYQGIISSKNETDIILKLPGGMVQNFKTSALKSVKQLPNSMMPEGLADAMSTTDLVNLVEYLTTLKKK